MFRGLSGYGSVLLDKFNGVCNRSDGPRSTASIAEDSQFTLSSHAKCNIGIEKCKAHLTSTRSSTWLHMATNKSKKSLPPISISICMVPLRLNVFRLRMMRAR